MKKYWIKPAEQRVVVLPERPEERTTNAGIIIPTVAEGERPEIGLIVAIGTGDADYPMKYLAGQKVIYSQYAGLEMELDLKGYGRNRYKVMNQLDVIGVIQEIEE